MKIKKFILLSGGFNFDFHIAICNGWTRITCAGTSLTGKSAEVAICSGISTVARQENTDCRYPVRQLIRDRRGPRQINSGPEGGWHFCNPPVEISVRIRRSRASDLTHLSMSSIAREVDVEPDPLFAEKERRFVRKTLPAINAQIVALLSTPTL